MKTSLALLACCLLSFSVFAQPKMQPEDNPRHIIGSVSFGPDLLAELSYTVQGSDTLYRFHYLDQNYKQVGHYKDITFGHGELKAFYNLLKSAFLPQNAPVRNTASFVIEYTLGNKDVMLTNLKRLRDMQVIFSTPEGNVVGLTEPQVDRLFGYQP